MTVLPDLTQAAAPLPAMRRGPSPRFDRDQIRELVKTMSREAVARQLGCSLATVYNALKETTNVVRLPTVRKRLTKSRFVSEPLAGERATMPAYDHPALMAGHTIYPTTVRAGRERWALKSGANTAKIGAEILKGKWAGFAAYTLTLEERATCPKACRHWRSCYGNKMHLADRVAAGPDLEWRLEREVAALELEHLNGFAVRLHNLGDFYSVEYVELWRRLLDKHAALHVWGYSARWNGGADPIAAALIALVEQQWDRFAIRFSNAPVEALSTISIEHPYQKPDDAVICPEQMGQTESCSTCALCWQTKKRIAFLQH